MSEGDTVGAIPDAASFAAADRVGFLHKFYRGPSFLFGYLSSWKIRYCVLRDGKFFHYDDNTKSMGTDRSSSVINLAYFDRCEEASKQDAKKVQNAFVIYNSDSGTCKVRHLFYAGSADEMSGWIIMIRNAMVAAARPSKKRRDEVKSRTYQKNPKSNNAKKKKVPTATLR